MWDDDPPPQPARRVTPILLEPMGVAELQEYIAELKTEIARAEAAIERKHGHRGAADSFFRKPA